MCASILFITSDLRNALLVSDKKSYDVYCITNKLKDLLKIADMFVFCTEVMLWSVYVP